jgi:hypothetical protein
MSLQKRHQLNIIFFIFLFVIYFTLFIALDKLQYPPRTDEPNFWQTSLLFSHSLIPSLELLKNYNELNTPLPFIIFGILEYLFKGGIFAGRLFTLIVSFFMTCLIGFPKGKVTKESAFSVIGLLIFPYYLILSGRLYTDIIAAFFVLLGFCLYIRSRHILSSVAFILAIASRQFMLAFPVAITAFELVNYLINKIKIYRLSKNYNSYLTEQKVKIAKKQINAISWIMPLIASLSIVGWILFFDDIAPQASKLARDLPQVQQKLWSIDLSNSCFALSCIGLYFVIPELILFRPKLKWHNIFTAKNYSFAAILLVLFISFPLTEAQGILIRFLRLLPHELIQLILLYSLGLLAFLRFSYRINLTFWIVLMHCGLMLKAYPWDKYILPVLIILWYLKSRKLLDRRNPLKLKF